MESEPNESRSSIGDRVTLVVIVRQLARAAFRLGILPLQWLAAQFRVGSLSRKRLAVWATLLFVVATALAMRQYIAPFEWHQPYALLRWRWWLYPLEWNPDGALPKIDGNINAVLATSDGACLWIAGDAGLLAFSGDQGKNWTQLSFDPLSGDFRAPADAQACGRPGGAKKPTSWLTPVPEVYAASAPNPGAQQVPPQQDSQQQTQSALPQSKSGPSKASQQNSSPPSVGSSASAPTLLVFPAQVDFGSAIASRKYPPARASIHIRNLSPGPISLSRVAISPIAFQVDQDQKDSCSDHLIASGGECIVPLTFAPRKAGEIQGQLMFAFSDESKPRIVSLFGVGEDPPESAAAPTDASTGDKTPSSRGGSNSRNAGGSTQTSSTQNSLSKPSVQQTAPGTSDSSGYSTRKAKAPDLWGFEDSQGRLGYILTADANFYAPENLGLIWRRAGLAFFNLPRTMSIADKELEFVDDRPYGGYRLKAVGTQMFPPTPGKQITSASIAGPVGRQRGWAINYLTASSAGDRTPDNLMRTQILYTADSGANWSVLNTFPGEVLKSAHFRSDGRTGWVAGDNGVLLGTVNAGATWQPLTFAAGRLLRQGRWTAPKESEQYIRFVPPWYLMALLICGVLVTPILFPVDVSESPDKTSPEFGGETKVPQVAGAKEADASTIGNQAIADKPLEPGDPDALGLSTIAAGLAFFLRNEKTKPPLAIAINGRWGSGKTSLMNLLKSNLEAWGAHPVWFNAWHHQKEDQMLAALLQAVKTQAVPPLWQTSGVTFRAKLAWRRLQRSWFNLVLVAGGIFLVYKAGTFVASTFQVSFLSLVKTVFSGSRSTEAVNKLKDKPILTILTAAGAIYKIISSGFTAFGTKPASLLASVSGGTNIKDLDAQTSFRQRFASEFDDVTQSLGKNQRMLILIDDLDRCRPEKVREVLEGVNFLASSGDCFIVLGMARDIVEHCVGLSFARVVDTMSWEAMGLTPRDIARALEEARLVEESKEKFQAPVETAAGETASNMEPYAKRHAFAHLYLDKLIQIEVSVPEPTPLQRRQLFRSEEEIKKNRNPNEQRVQAVMEKSRRIYAGAQPVVAAALAALVLFGLWTLVRPAASDVLKSLATNELNTGDKDQGKTPATPSATSVAAQSSPPASTNSAPPSGVPTPSSGATSSASSASPTAKPGTPANEGVSPYGQQPSQYPRPAIVEYSAGIFTTGWPFYLLLLGTVSLIATSLRRLPQRIVRDEAPFTNALAVWHPLVMTGGAKNTPRTARRFQNRVRYLAMRQRALLRGKAMSLGERWLRDRLNSPLPRIDRPVHLAENQDINSTLVDEAHEVRELVEAGQSGKCGSWQVKVSADRMELSASGPANMPEEQFKALVLGNVYIPEPLLVAFAAIEEYAPEWIANEDLFQSKVVHPTPGSAKEEKGNMLSKTLEEHSRYWDNWHNLAQYRRAYLALCSEMTRGGTSSTGGDDHVSPGKR
ncbi:MAG TPA: P-loop NTPase fold protein [Terriglobales bacterium]|jgi:hypothetical protein|nr:P-loop NTPase fold protein [Terriglobales bacterium]